MRGAVLLLLMSLAASNGRAQDTAPLQALLQGHYDEAIGGFRELARRQPANVDAVKGLVRGLMETGQYDAAIEAGTHAAERVGSGVEAQNTLGEALLARGRWDDAEAAFRSAVIGRAADSLRARLNLALLMERRGRRAEASRAFDGFIDVYNRGSQQLTSAELAVVGTAVKHLGRENWELYHDATRAFQEALDRDATNSEAELLLGELFLEKYNGTEARGSFDNILGRNPNNARALLGKAAALRFAGEPGSVEHAERSLAVNPSFVGAHVFLALYHLEALNRAAARASVAQALRVDPRSLEALSVLAAIELSEGNQGAFDQVRRRVFALSTSFADFYTALSEAAARGRLYQTAGEFANEAIRLDTLSWRAYAMLGMNQLRRGVMDSGRANLERAFLGDPFDVWTKNTLDLLDTLDRYDIVESPHFRFVIDPGESALLSIYAIDVAEEAFARFKATYRYEPTEPIRIEVFPTHGDFSVRTVGLVGMGALGVSFGPVIAMDAPAARQRSGERGNEAMFNWGSTLWHEISHSFHLGMSGHRVPRWFTEGLAVFEERRARQGWGDGPTPEFLMAYREGLLWPASELENGFVRPRFPQQVILSYYQASLMCEMIARDHGDDGFRRILAAYRGGATDEEMFARVLGVTPQQLDEQFDAFVHTTFVGELEAVRGHSLDPEKQVDEAAIAARAADRPGDFLAQLLRGKQLLERDRPRDAIPFLERAKRMFPAYAGSESPYAFLAVARAQSGDTVGATRELEALLERNAGDYAGAVQLFRFYEALGQPSGALRALDRAFYVYPYDAALHVRLAELAAESRQWTLAVRERRALVALRPVDRAAALYQLAFAYYEAGNVSDARRTVLQALEIAPNFAEAQDLLLTIHGTRRDAGNPDA